MFEQPFDDGGCALRFDAEHSLAEAPCRRRPQKARPLECRFALGQLLQGALHNAGEELARVVQVFFGDGTVTTLLPFTEKLLENTVDDLSLAAWIDDLLVRWFFFDRKDVLREEPERTPDIGLERADRPRAHGLASGGAMEFRVGRCAPAKADARP